jgi:flagellar export protein FliJ
MKKFKFRLDRILKYNTSLKKEKERQLMMERAKLNEAEASRLMVEQEQERMDQCGVETTSMAELMLRGEYLDALQRLLENQRELVKKANEAVEVAREEYVTQSREEKTLLMMKDKKKGEYNEEKSKHEKVTTDSINTMRHRFKGAGL